MRRPGLLPLVREEISRLVNGYLDAPALDTGIADFVVSPGLGARAGMLGAIALAQSG
jgi:fructokinase